MGKQMTNREIEHDLGQLIQAVESNGKHLHQLMQRVDALEKKHEVSHGKVFMVCLIGSLAIVIPFVVWAILEALFG